MLPALLFAIKKKILSKSHNSYKFLATSILVTIIFGLLYYINSQFCLKYYDTAIELNMIAKDKNNRYKKLEDLPKENFITYLWFSLVTQTTVGYGTRFEHADVFTLNKYINLFQLLSIFLLTAFL